MFVQIFRNDTQFVMVNINHILFLEPVRNQPGCRVTLTNGTDFYSVEAYTTILENISNIK